MVFKELEYLIIDYLGDFIVTIIFLFDIYFAKYKNLKICYQDLKKNLEKKI